MLWDITWPLATQQTTRLRSSRNMWAWWFKCWCTLIPPKTCCPGMNTLIVALMWCTGSGGHQHVRLWLKLRIHTSSTTTTNRSLSNSLGWWRAWSQHSQSTFGFCFGSDSIGWSQLPCFAHVNDSIWSTGSRSESHWATVLCSAKNSYGKAHQYIESWETQLCHSAKQVVYAIYYTDSTSKVQLGSHPHHTERLRDISNMFISGRSAYAYDKIC